MLSLPLAGSLMAKEEEYSAGEEYYNNSKDKLVHAETQQALQLRSPRGVFSGSFDWG